MTRTPTRGLLLLAAGLFVQPEPALAQSSALKWEIELHAGSQSAGTPTGGTSQLPPTGPEFTYAGVRSRRVPSWYFGDGASLFNETLVGLGLPCCLSPLDPVLTNAVMVRPSGGTVGFRISRRLTPRFAAEFAVDTGASAPRMTQSALNQIEDTRADFFNHWQRFFPSPAPPLTTMYFIQKTFSSTSDVEPGRGGRQTLATVALRVNLVVGRRVQPYVTVGAGVGRDTAGSAGFSLTGRYQVTAGVSTGPSSVLGPFDESDTVTVRYAVKDSFPVGVVGGGINVDLPGRHGIRFDVRFFLRPDPSETVVSATPIGVMGSPAFDFVRGNLVFSNNASAFSSLSGAPIVDFKTRTGGRITRTVGFDERHVALLVTSRTEADSPKLAFSRTDAPGAISDGAATRSGFEALGPAGLQPQTSMPTPNPMTERIRQHHVTATAGATVAAR